MSLDSTIRRVVYQGDGKTKAFPFRFKVFASSDVVVQVAASDESSPTTLSYGVDYTVALNADQENEPGGTVATVVAPENGASVAVISGIPETQPMVLTPYDGFNPETLNTSADRSVALIQQLSERLDRAVTVDATDTMTPSELKQKLLDAATDATGVAKGYAESAKASAEAAAESEEKTAGYAKTAQVLEPFVAEIKATADGIDAIKTTAENIDDVKTVAANTEDVHSVAEHIDDVTLAAKVSPHIDDISSINAHIDEVHRVGQDLVGMSSPYFDLGSVTETPDEVTKVVDGYIKKVAEHIDDCIHPVGDNLDAVKTVAEQLDPINDVANLSRIDYEAIFLNGLSTEGDVNGLSN